jgi:hypothetical protein
LKTELIGEDADDKRQGFCQWSCDCADSHQTCALTGQA